MLLLIDNYDSFTYNLFHFLGELGAEIEVRRNDKVTAAEASIHLPGWGRSIRASFGPAEIKTFRVPSDPARIPDPGVRVCGSKNTGLPSAPTLLNDRTSLCTVPVSEKNTDPSRIMS